MVFVFQHNGSPLPLQEGIPPAYEGYRLHGGNAFHGHGDDMSIVIQVAETARGYFRILHVHGGSSARIRCAYRHDEDMLCVRTILHHPLTEWIKGGGPQKYDEKQFVLLFGRRWQSFIAFDKPGDYTFFDMVYRENGLVGRPKNHAEVKKGFRNVYEHIPERITGQRLFLTLEMHRILLEMRTGNYADTASIEEKMDKYLANALLEVDGYHWKKINFRWVKEPETIPGIRYAQRVI